MTQIDVRARVHAGRAWRKWLNSATQCRNSGWRNPTFDLDDRSDLFLTFFALSARFLMFSAAWPNARASHVTILTADEATLVEDTVAVMTG